MNGLLILGKATRIIDIDCKDKYAIVRIDGKTQRLQVPYDAISWVSDDWFDDVNIKK